jgi:hypothetical protein
MNAERLFIPGLVSQVTVPKKAGSPLPEGINMHLEKTGQFGDHRSYGTPFCKFAAIAPAGTVINAVWRKVIVTLKKTPVFRINASQIISSQKAPISELPVGQVFGTGKKFRQEQPAVIIHGNHLLEIDRAAIFGEDAFVLLAGFLSRFFCFVHNCSLLVSAR